MNSIEMETTCGELDIGEVKLEEWILPDAFANGSKQESTCGNHCSHANDQLEKKFAEMIETVKQESKMTRATLKKEAKDIRATLKKEVKVIRETLNKEVNDLRGQLQIAVEALAEQKVMISQLLQIDADDQSLESRFPLQTEEDMHRMNEEIDSENMGLYVKTIKFRMGPLGVRKGLKHILCNEIVEEYNIDGLQKKKALKSVENFFKALLAAIPDDERGTSEMQLRDAIFLQKKRHLKKKRNTMVARP